MQGFIELIRNMVVIVLLIELLMQLQSGKSYEPYFKVFVGLFVVYSLVCGLSSSFREMNLDRNILFSQGDNFVIEKSKESEREIGPVEISIKEISVERIEIERVGVEE